MKTKEKIHYNVTKQLDRQGIRYEILSASEIACAETSWRNKFIDKMTAPHLDKYKWHIFSFHLDKCIDGNLATIEYKKQFPTEIYIFNERLLYGIKCFKTTNLPDINTHNFSDDIYVCHHNMKWTYVIPHEFPGMGPYFCK